MVQLTDVEWTEIQGKLNKLTAFKRYVHDRLDAAGVPADPDSPHKAEGCRVGGRLDALIRARNAAEARAEKAETLLTRAYHTANREAWQDGPTTSEVVTEILDHLCNVGKNPTVEATDTAEALTSPNPDRNESQKQWTD